MNLFVLCDNSSRSASNQITPTCPQRFIINRRGLQVILTHISFDLSPLVWVLVVGEIYRRICCPREDLALALDVVKEGSTQS